MTVATPTTATIAVSSELTIDKASPLIARPARVTNSDHSTTASGTISHRKLRKKSRIVTPRSTIVHKSQAAAVFFEHREALREHDRFAGEHACRQALGKFANDLFQSTNCRLARNVQSRFG